MLASRINKEGKALKGVCLRDLHDKTIYVTRIDEANTVEAHVSKGRQKHIQLTEGVLNPKAKSGLWLSTEGEKPNEFKGVKTHDEQPIKRFRGLLL